METKQKMPESLKQEDYGNVDWEKLLEMKLENVDNFQLLLYKINSLNPFECVFSTKVGVAFGATLATYSKCKRLDLEALLLKLDEDDWKERIQAQLDKCPELDLDSEVVDVSSYLLQTAEDFVVEAFGLDKEKDNDNSNGRQTGEHTETIPDQPVAELRGEDSIQDLINKTKNVDDMVKLIENGFITVENLIDQARLGMDFVHPTLLLQVLEAVFEDPTVLIEGEYFNNISWNNIEWQNVFLEAVFKLLGGSAAAKALRKAFLEIVNRNVASSNNPRLIPTFLFSGIAPGLANVFFGKQDNYKEDQLQYMGAVEQFRKAQLPGNQKGSADITDLEIEEKLDAAFKGNLVPVSGFILNQNFPKFANSREEAIRKFQTDPLKRFEVVFNEYRTVIKPCMLWTILAANCPTWATGRYDRSTEDNKEAIAKGFQQCGTLPGIITGLQQVLFGQTFWQLEKDRDIDAEQLIDLLPNQIKAWVDENALKRIITDGEAKKLKQEAQNNILGLINLYQNRSVLESEVLKNSPSYLNKFFPFTRGALAPYRMSLAIEDKRVTTLELQRMLRSEGVDSAELNQIDMEELVSKPRFGQLVMHHSLNYYKSVKILDKTMRSNMIVQTEFGYPPRQQFPQSSYRTPTQGNQGERYPFSQPDRSAFSPQDSSSLPWKPARSGKVPLNIGPPSPEKVVLVKKSKREQEMSQEELQQKRIQDNMSNLSPDQLKRLALMSETLSKHNTKK